MVRRKPVRLSLAVLSILSIPLIFMISILFIIPALLFLVLIFNTPLTQSKCPRCRKNNELEPWTLHYRCAHCQASLKKEDHHWSRLL